MTNYSVGHHAEQVASAYLLREGYKIRDINWRTKYCEIDIVAEKSKTIYFVEVKYRKSTLFGSGLEYITKNKQKQMSFAAELWCSKNEWVGDYQLSAIEITGNNYQDTNFVIDI